MGVASPPILPGCLVIYVNAFDQLRTATVIQFIRHESHYEATVIQDERIRPLILRHKDMDNSWRVLVRAT